MGDVWGHLTYEDLNAAFRALSAGAPFLALATNRVFNGPDGELALDVGAIVEALRYSSGVDPIVMGKPSPEFFRAAAASMGCDISQVTMIGDDAEFDVAGALDAGAGAGILVRTGKYTRGDEDLVFPSPTAVAENLAAAVELLFG